MATQTAIKKHAKHLMEVNPNYTLEEAMDVALFDLEYTNTDAACRQFLEENTKDSDISLEEAEIMFTKKKKTQKKSVLTDEQKQYNATVMEDIRKRRVEYLVSEIEKRPELFGTEINYSLNAIEGIAPDSNLPYTIKISKHKVQKVFSKEVIRKKNAKDVTPAEQRAMSLGFILATAPAELFEALSFANSAFGFVNRDPKYPFGSIKITQHKRAKED